MGTITVHVSSDGDPVIFDSGESFIRFVLNEVMSRVEDKDSDFHRQLFLGTINGHLDYYKLAEEEKRVFATTIEQLFVEELRKIVSDDIAVPSREEREGFMQRTSVLRMAGKLYGKLYLDPWFRENML